MNEARSSALALPERVRFGFEEAARRLGRGPARWDLGAVSVALKFALLGPEPVSLRDPSEPAPRGSAPEHLGGLSAADYDWLLDRIVQELPFPISEAQRRALRAETFGRRIGQLVLEQRQGERSAPEWEIYPEGIPWPDPPRDLERSLCIVFEAPLHFANEFYPLAVDAFVCGQTTRPPVTLVAAHASWLAPTLAVRRLQHADVGADRMVETDCEPFVPSRIWVLAARPEGHDAIESRALAAGVGLLNPWANHAEVLEDKMACASAWLDAGVPTPLARLLSFEEAAAFRRELTRIVEELGPHLVLQPNGGTEGAGVEVFRLDRAEDADRAVRHAAGLIDRGQAVLVRTFVEGIRFAESPAVEPVPCDLRILVSSTGGHRSAESGFLQVGTASSGGIASAGRQGRILKFSKHALDRLVHPKSGEPVALSGADWERIVSVAERAAATLPEIALVGLDLRLRLGGDGRIDPVVLDANPRPAGLAHAEYLPGLPQALEPGVSQRLWSPP